MRKVALCAVFMMLAAGCAAPGQDATETSAPPAPGPRGTLPAASCQPEFAEPLHPNSTHHVLPGAITEDDPAAYSTEPPTSGPHLSGKLPSGALETPITRATQVALLEKGTVLLQHKELPTASVNALNALAGENVVVAPNPNLNPGIVATAWTRKMVCDDADTTALQRFVDDYAGQPAGTHD